jgi:hypothetical protein
MKNSIRLFTIFVLLIGLFALPTLAFAQDENPEDTTVLGGEYTLEDGESLNHLTVLGGNVELKAGSTTNYITVFGGNLTIEGTVQEDIQVIGGNLELKDTAVVNGDVSLVGGSMDRDEGATVAGNVSQGLPFNIHIPGIPVFEGPVVISRGESFAWQAIGFITQTLGLSALAMLVILIAPKPVERASTAAFARPWEAGGLGLLVAILTPVLLIGFAITLIGIPISLILVLVAVIIVTYGWIALGLEVGKRLSVAFRQDWPLIVDAGLGTFLLSIVANGIGLTPCVGWIVPTLVGFLGMGGVLLSRFGTQTYPPTAPVIPVSS